MHIYYLQPECFNNFKCQERRFHLSCVLDLNGNNWYIVKLRFFYEYNHMVSVLSRLWLNISDISWSSFQQRFLIFWYHLWITLCSLLHLLKHYASLSFLWLIFTSVYWFGISHFTYRGHISMYFWNSQCMLPRTWLHFGVIHKTASSHFLATCLHHWNM